MSERKREREREKEKVHIHGRLLSKTSQLTSAAVAHQVGTQVPGSHTEIEREKDSDRKRNVDPFYTVQLALESPVDLFYVYVNMFMCTHPPTL